MSSVLAALSADRNRDVLHYPGGSLTAGQFLDSVYRVARALLGDGCGRGRVVAMLGPVSPRLFVCSHAIELVGAAQLEVPLALSAREQAKLIDECEAAYVVADTDHVDGDTLRAVAALPGVRMLTLASGEVGEDLFGMAEEHSAEPLPSLAQPGDLMRISLTGGTTGRAKPVVRRFGSAPDLKSTWLGRLLRRGNAGPSRALLADRLTGMIRTLGNASLVNGGQCVLLPDFAPERVSAAVQHYGITHVILPAHQLRAFLEIPCAAGPDLSSLRCVVSGGGPLSPALLRRAVTRFGPIVHNSYGQTEAGNISWLTPEDYAGGDPEALRSCGRPVTGAEVEIRDARGGVAAANERGRVWVRTPLLMDGYLNRPQDTARVLREGWLDTEDVGFRNEQGLLTVLGRSSDAMAINGETVFSAEVDTVVQEHPAVQDSATFDVRSEGGGTLHTAVVPRPRSALSETELRDLVRGRLGDARTPTSVLFVRHIPHTYAHELCWDTLRSWHTAGRADSTGPAACGEQSPRQGGPLAVAPDHPGDVVER